MMYLLSCSLLSCNTASNDHSTRLRYISQSDVFSPKYQQNHSTAGTQYDQERPDLRNRLDASPVTSIHVMSKWLRFQALAAVSRKHAPMVSLQDGMCRSGDHNGRGPNAIDPGKPPPETNR